MKPIYLLPICSLLVLLSGCAGLAKTIHLVGSTIPGETGQIIKMSANGLNEIEIQAQRRQQEAEKQRRIDEYNRRLAAMTPEQRKLFKEQERQRIQANQKMGFLFLQALSGAMSQSEPAGGSMIDYNDPMIQMQMKASGLR